MELRDCHKSCVSSYVSVTRQSSQGKKRRSSSASDTHRVLKSQVKSQVRVYKKNVFCAVRSAKNSTQNIKSGGFHSKDVRQNRSKKKSTPLRTHCLIYFINVKMSKWVALRLADVRCDLPASDGMYHVITYFAKYSWIRVVDLALNHCRTLSTL